MYDTLIFSSKFNLGNYARQFTDLNFAYSQFSVPNKQQFPELVFNNQLYLSKEGYRTPYAPILMFDKGKSISHLAIKKEGKSNAQNARFPTRSP